MSRENSDSSSFPLLKGKNFIVLGEDYQRHPHCLEHIMNCFLQDNRILWVETMGSRPPRLTWYDCKRTLEILWKWAGQFLNRPKKIANSRIHIISPMLIPYNQFAFIRKWNKRSIKKAVSKALHDLNMPNPIVITSVPQAGDLIKELGEICSIYYCVDEFSLWPGLSSKLVEEMEAKLMQKADLILATSQELIQKRRSWGKDIHLLTHGVDIDHFTLTPSTVPSVSSRPISHPLRFCYFGLIDERCDQQLLVKVARNFPHNSLTIIGPVVTPVDKLKQWANITFIGKVPYQDLPRYLENQDLLLLPYHLNELTKAINPLKLKEYLCTGKPVVSTALPSVTTFRDFLFMASSHEEFLSYLQRLQEGILVHRPEETLHYLRKKESWEQKARELSFLIMNFMK